MLETYPVRVTWQFSPYCILCHQDLPVAFGKPVIRWLFSHSYSYRYCVSRTVFSLLWLREKWCENIFLYNTDALMNMCMWDVKVSSAVIYMQLDRQKKGKSCNELHSWPAWIWIALLGCFTLLLGKQAQIHESIESELMRSNVTWAIKILLP